MHVLTSTDCATVAYFSYSDKPLLSQATARANAAVPQAVAAAATDAEKHKAKIVADEANYVLQTYGRPSDLVIVRGEGSKVYDASGKEYLDFAAGIAVNALGHGDKRWVKAVQDQAATLMHTSNLFHTVPQVDSMPSRLHLRLPQLQPAEL